VPGVAGEAVYVVRDEGGAEVGGVEGELDVRQRQAGDVAGEDAVGGEGLAEAAREQSRSAPLRRRPGDWLHGDGGDRRSSSRPKL
jgi:hypothetical protein